MMEETFNKQVSLKTRLLIVGAKTIAEEIKRTAEERIEKLWRDTANLVEEEAGLPNGFIKGPFTLQNDCLVIPGRSDEQVTHERSGA